MDCLTKKNIIYLSILCLKLLDELNQINTVCKKERKMFKKQQQKKGDKFEYNQSY